MTFSEIATDATSVLGAVGVICTVLAHLPFPAKYAQLFARIALYASNAKFSVNQRDTMPPTPKAPTFGSVGPVSGMLALCLCLSMTGCNWLTHSVEPVLKHCEPSPAALVAQVEQILISGGDYTKELEQLAIADTAQAVECAVETAISLLAGRVGADSSAGPAVARGKAYLAAHKDQK